jgi:predicted RND superfamily exporter protein
MTPNNPRFGGLFAWLLSHRALGFTLVVGLTVLLGFFAQKVKPDYSVEHLFPVRTPSREAYDRFKRQFPSEDAVAVVVVEATDLFTPAGLSRIQSLERDLRTLPGVAEVIGPMSVPSPDLSSTDIERRRNSLTRDALYAWNIAKPDGKAVTIQAMLETDAASSDAGRQRFFTAARQLLEKHQVAGQKLILSGVPSIRAQFAKMVGDDVGRLIPLALLVVLLLLFVAYRNLGSVLACLVTVVASLVWSFGAAGLLGYPLTVTLSVTPIIIIIVSLSDTVHVVNEFAAHRRQGLDVRRALVETMPRVAVPCLLTEVVLACGFMSLAAVNITAVVQFGIATALAMLLTWLANMLVLPLALSLLKTPANHTADAEPWAVQAFGRVLDRISTLVVERPGRVLGVAFLVLVAAVLGGLRIQKISYAFDDLRPDSQFFKDLRSAEAAHGGLIPIAILIEATGEDGALEPALVALADRTAAFLEGFPEIHQANSVADYVRKGRQLTGAAIPEEDLPQTRDAMRDALLPFAKEKSHLSVLSADGKSLAVMAGVLDVGSIRVNEMLRQIEAWTASEQAALDGNVNGPRAKIHVTGQLQIFKDVNASLTEGLAGSLAVSLLLSFLAMCVVLRSWRLGLVGLVPNVVPIVLVLGFMGFSGIHLSPSTVVLFSITLVIAEDDTIQYLSRFRAHYLADEIPAGVDRHRAIALRCLREVGLPMFITSTAVSLGFLILLFSRFLGPAHLGALLAGTLFSAVFADLFLTPILLMKLKPLRSIDGDRSSRSSGVS